MDDKLKREIRDMARKKRDEMREIEDRDKEVSKALEDARRELAKQLESARRDFDAERMLKLKNGAPLTEAEVEILKSIKLHSKLKSRSIPSTPLPTIESIWPEIEGLPTHLYGFPIEEDETIYPFSEYELEYFGYVFSDESWFGYKIHRTIFAFLDDQFIVWNASHYHNTESRQFLNIPNFVDKILDIRFSNVRWIQSYALIEHPQVWYRGTLSWKRKILERVEGSKSIVFRQLHEDIWNYLSHLNLDPTELEFFDLRLDTYDPTIPLNEYEIAKIYEVGIEILESGHKPFVKPEIPDSRKKTFASFGDSGLFTMVYDDDLAKKFRDSEG